MRETAICRDVLEAGDFGLGLGEGVAKKSVFTIIGHDFRRPHPRPGARPRHAFARSVERLGAGGREVRHSKRGDRRPAVTWRLLPFGSVHSFGRAVRLVNSPIDTLARVRATGAERFGSLNEARVARGSENRYLAAVDGAQQFVKAAPHQPRIEVLAAVSA